jgi:membrane protein implicated in regulation of membrane protease activity
VYVVLLGVGLGFLIISLAVGELLELEGTNFLPVSPAVIAASLVAAGGTGLLLQNRLEGIFVLPVAIAAGLVIGYALNIFVIRPLHRAQNTSTVDQQSLIGMAARVTSLIPQGGYGQITYSVNGSRVSSPARAVDGNSLIAGTQVEISYIEERTFYVTAV